MVQARSFLQRVPLAPAIASLFALAAAILVAATPQWLFEANIASSGLGALLPDAQPPLGIKARLLAIVATAAFTGLIVWLIVRAAESLIEGPGVRFEDDDDALDLAGYAATLPEMPPRRPISAESELGAPLMSDEALKNAAILVEPPVLADLEDTVEAKFEGIALPDEALAVSETVDVAPFVPEAVDESAHADTAAADDAVGATSLAEPLKAAEFDLPATDDYEPVAGESSIEALIRRLEAGLSRRDPPLPPTPGTPSPVPPPQSGDWMVRDAPVPDNGDDDRILGALRRMAG